MDTLYQIQAYPIKSPICTQKLFVIQEARAWGVKSCPFLQEYFFCPLHLICFSFPCFEPSQASRYLTLILGDILPILQILVLSFVLSTLGHKVSNFPAFHFLMGSKFSVTALTQGTRNELKGLKSHIRATVSRNTAIFSLHNLVNKEGCLMLRLYASE